MFLFQESNQAIKEKTPAEYLNQKLKDMIQQIRNKVADMDWEKLKDLPQSERLSLTLTRLNNDLKFLKEELDKMTPEERSKLEIGDLKKIVLTRPKN